MQRCCLHCRVRGVTCCSVTAVVCELTPSNPRSREGTAPCCVRVSMTWMWPFEAAHKHGVWMLTSAPNERRASTTSNWPFCAANSRSVNERPGMRTRLTVAGGMRDRMLCKLVADGLTELQHTTSCVSSGSAVSAAGAGGSDVSPKGPPWQQIMASSSTIVKNPRVEV